MDLFFGFSFSFSGLVPDTCLSLFCRVVFLGFESNLSVLVLIFLTGKVKESERMCVFGGFTPAPAGEPFRCARQWGVPRVYPRACGGTSARLNSYIMQHGLSPRLRGNHCAANRMCRWGRSIPAPAGEPRILSSALARSAVYPRACGGTDLDYEDADQYVGLSPRLRGNPSNEHRYDQSRGSIPAPAGEPRSGRSYAVS